MSASFRTKIGIVSRSGTLTYNPIQAILLGIPKQEIIAWLAFEPQRDFLGVMQETVEFVVCGGAEQGKLRETVARNDVGQPDVTASERFAEPRPNSVRFVPARRTSF